MRWPNDFYMFLAMSDLQFSSGRRRILNTYEASFALCSVGFGPTRRVKVSGWSPPIQPHVASAAKAIDACAAGRQRAPLTIAAVGTAFACRGRVNRR